MPMITVQYSTPRAKAGLAEAIAQAANKLSADILRNDPAITAVVVEEINPANWFVGNASLAQHQLSAFWLDIRATEGTKTREEKAAFVAAAFAKMGELLGPLHNESYIYVNDARGDGYGYGGLTQNERYIAGKFTNVAKAAA
jgi:4-oxalocrotonate tautomerase